jgi:hypothetical protein
MQLTPSAWPVLGTVDLRFQSYNVEMVEVTGGRFWAPYATMAAGGDRYRERPPVDLEDPQLRRLTAALGPAYMRVSGTWANWTYFSDADPAPAAPPPGFDGLLTHPQWQGVVDFAQAVDAEITLSVAISTGVRDAAGQWLPDQARRLFAYTHAIGGRIAAAEFMNEPSAAAGAPEGYDAVAYARDFRAFRALIAEVSPRTLIAGPSALGDRPDAPPEAEPALSSRKLLEADPSGLDVFSYHHYGAASRRCAGDAWWPQTRAQDALGEDWLGRTETQLAVYRALRDRFAPGTPLWLTETADTVCGGNPWAASFLDSFRYLDQLGRLARLGVQVVMHNTLAASDYGLIDEATLSPRPNYWCALLWRRLMDARVLDVPPPARANLRLYAHGLRDRRGGVALLALNTDRQKARALTLPVAATRYTLSAEDLQARTVKLNGVPLKLAADGTLPALVGAEIPPGTLDLPPASITFLAIPAAA